MVDEICQILSTVSMDYWFVNRAQVKAGMAWWYRAYSDGHQGPQGEGFILRGQGRHQGEELYETIHQGPRHHSATILLDAAAQERLFPAWTMGFRDLADPELDAMPGFAPFREIRLTSGAIGQDAHGCLDVLGFFHDSR